MLWLLAGSASGAVILQYHNVSEDTPASTSVAPAQFAAHLEKLEQEGFRVVSLDTLVSEVRGGLDPREKVVAITFDDGARNIYDNALPMLDRRGWKASVFVTTGLVGKRGMMSADQLRDMNKRGHLVLNHSRTHPHMVRSLPGESDAQRTRRIEGEIVGAQRSLETWLETTPPRYFAWPFGEYDALTVDALRKLGYTGFAQGSGAVDASGPWHAVPRIPVNRHYAEWSALRDKLLALPMPVRRTKPAFGVTRDARPVLELWLEGDWTEVSLSCFAGGEAITPKQQRDGDYTKVTLRAGVPEGRGRGRYTCTAPAGEGRFWWYSWMWMRKAGDSWYPES